MWKVIRTVVQFALLGALIFFIVRETSVPQQILHTFQADEADSAAERLSGDEARFISIAYTGVAESEAQDSAIVSRRSFEAQMAALKASGYQTISQEDIIDAWLYHGSLPKKSLFLIFEDGIRATTDLVQPTLEKHNYRATVCTYAQNFYDQNNLFLSVADVRRLLDSKYWELGTNGWRLSYINIYDRYENYFGHLNAKEFVQINQYLRRDYNHYLMDFLRDEDRLREESLEAMKERVAFDYESMSQDYIND
ncbi:MAG: polysaccharide deacetylase family protein, partial [Eubacteriales bacterium]|nr:polysaccharide deacetylase family protein [Eubacteriales bacterium]